MVSQCEADRYDKPLLSVAMARNLSLSGLVKETGAAAALRLQVALFSNTTAISINTSHQALRTTLGSIHYQHLVIAQGARSVLPAHLPAEHCWRINHLNQYARFRNALGSTPRRVLVIGAGLIGAELTNDLALAGHHVTLVDIAPRPLARLLTQAEQAEALLKAWEPLQIEFLGNTEVLEVKPSSVQGYEVRLSHERHVAVDEIVVATGLKTCDRLANSANLAWNNGIVVDSTTLVTSTEGIYALGDCISIAGETSRFIEPIGRQARTIASQIVGDALIPYQNQRVPVRIKTTSLQLTVK
jgi:rubredoxin-NAD+ reductase